MAAATRLSPLAGSDRLLLGSLGAGMGVGALIGWRFGSRDIGLLIGALVGIPLAVGVVYGVYTRRRAADVSAGIFSTPRPMPGRARARARRRRRWSLLALPGLRARRLAARRLGARRGALGRRPALGVLLTRLPLGTR